MTDKITEIVNTNKFMAAPEKVPNITEHNRRQDDLVDGKVAVHQDATTPDDFVSYKEIVEEQKIVCGNCGKHLMTIIVVDTSFPESKLKVYCPCGDSSFVYTIMGKGYQDVPDGVQIKDTTYDENSNLMEVYMV